MRFSTQQHRCYCGIDIHARTLALCVLDEAARATVAASPQAVLEALVPYRDGLAVASECMFAWYWLADLCEDQAIPFVPGHALYLKAIHGGKSKNDKLGAAKLAALLRGGAFPQAYVYPRALRAPGNLLRRYVGKPCTLILDALLNNERQWHAAEPLQVCSSSPKTGPTAPTSSASTPGPPRRRKRPPSRFSTAVVARHPTHTLSRR